MSGRWTRPKPLHPLGIFPAIRHWVIPMRRFQSCPLLENIFGGIPGLGDGKASQLAKRVVSHPAVSKILDVAGEGGEEALSTLVTPYIKRAIYDKNAKNATMEELADSAVQGILLSGASNLGMGLASVGNRVAEAFSRPGATEAPESLSRGDNARADTVKPEWAQAQSFGGEVGGVIDPAAKGTRRDSDAVSGIFDGAESSVPSRRGRGVITQAQSFGGEVGGVIDPAAKGTRRDNAEVSSVHSDPETSRVLRQIAEIWGRDGLQEPTLIENEMQKGRQESVKEVPRTVREQTPNLYAFRFDHPEVQTFYRQAAQELLEDVKAALDSAVRPRTMHGVDDKVMEAAEALIADRKQKNYTAAKRLESVLDDMLSEGYIDVQGSWHQPSGEYLRLKQEIPVYQNQEDSLSVWDMDENTDRAVQSAYQAGLGGTPVSDIPQNASLAELDAYEAGRRERIRRADKEVKTTVEKADSWDYTGNKRSKEGGLTHGREGYSVDESTPGVQGEPGADDTRRESERGRKAKDDRENVLSGQNSEPGELTDDVDIGRVIPEKGTAASSIVDQAEQEYGIETVVVKDSAWFWDYHGGEAPPARSRRGKIYIREGISSDDMDIVVPHEVTHIMQQVNFVPYIDFLATMEDRVNFSTTDARAFLTIILNHLTVKENDTRRRMNINDLEIEAHAVRFYDEVNAAIYGHYANGVTSGETQNGVLDLHNVLYDFDGYIRELSDIHQQFKNSRKDIVDNDGRARTDIAVQEGSLDIQSAKKADVWAASVNQAYQAGLSDLPESGVPTGASPAQRSAYEAGRAESIRRLEQELDSVSPAQADWFGSESGLVRDEFWKRAYLSSRDSRRMDALGKVLGVQIRFAETVADGRANAQYENGVITLALDAKDPVMTSLFHESVHRIREMSPESYDVLSGFVQNHMSTDKLDSVLKDRSRLYQTTDNTVLTEEVVADAFGVILKDSAVLDQLVKDNRAAAEKALDVVRDIISSIRRTLHQRNLNLTRNQKSAFRDLESRLTEMEGNFAQSLSRVEERAKKQIDITGITNNTVLEDADRDIIKCSMKEGGLYGEEGRAENRLEFLERSHRGARESGEVGGTAYAFVPVGVGETSYTAEQIAEELSKLGIDSFYHAGLEFNQEGKTFVDDGDSSTIENTIVAIFHKAFGDGKNIAGHEAFHIWESGKGRSEYLAILRENMKPFSVYGIEQSDIVRRAYFGSGISDKKLFAEEFFARISGQIHSGMYDADLATMFKDYSAVKNAWNKLIELNKK